VFNKLYVIKDKGKSYIYTDKQPPKVKVRRWKDHNYDNWHFINSGTVKTLKKAAKTAEPMEN